MTNLTIGADPEVFLRNPKTGKLISAAGLFPGTKENPFKVMYGAVQVDGMAAEYNIDPCGSAVEFTAKNLAVLAQLRDLIKQLNPDLEFEFVFSPIAEFGKEMIDAQPLENRILGCTPDYNAWKDGEENPIPDADMPFRTASGHIHLGWGSDYDIKDPEHIEACCMMAKQLDVTMLASIFVTEGKYGAKRRKLYGKAGAFRPKPYGMEYRSPSNVWLSNTTSITWMYNNANSAFNRLMNGQQDYENDYYQRVIKDVDKGNLNVVRGDYNPIDIYQGSPVTMDNLDKLVERCTRNAGLVNPINRDAPVFLGEIPMFAVGGADFPGGGGGMPAGEMAQFIVRHHIPAVPVNLLGEPIQGPIADFIRDFNQQAIFIDEWVDDENAIENAEDDEEGRRGAEMDDVG